MALTASTHFKAHFFVKRKASMSFEDFKRHQLDVHVPLALQLPGLIDYSLSFFEPVDGEDQAFDAMAIVTFESAEAQAAAMESDKGAAALADLPNYLDDPEEMVVLASAPGMTFAK
ncbi:MAG: EthD family reductase [Pseudomonadota bacterium]